MIGPDNKSPQWMLPNPEPSIAYRKFNLKEFAGWEGRAPTLDLVGWVDNPRLDIPVQLFKEENVGREPNNDELLDIMLDNSVNRGDEEIGEDENGDSRNTRKNKLLELAQSIRLNGIRVPLVVTSDKRILDGNRRYFATLYLHRITEDRDERENYSSVPVWVLPKGISRDDEDRILTELNSINDCYVKWPYSVTARRVYRDFQDGMSIEELRKKYHDWAENRIRTVIEASKVAEEFVEHHGDAAEAKDLAYRKLVWFDELRRSNKDALKKEDFRTSVYDLVLSPTTPFTSHADFKRLEEVYDNSEAWEVLTTREGKEALKQAIYTVDRDRFEGKSDSETRMKRINTLLSGIINGPGFGLVDASTLKSFQELSTKVPKSSLDVATRTEAVIELLNGLTSKEIAQLPEILLLQLNSVMERIKKQAESYRD